MNAQTEKEILKEEKEPMTEVKKEEKKIGKLLANVRLMIALAILVFIGATGTVWYFIAAGNVVKIENSQVAATAIDLAPTVGGKLEAVFVRAGDVVDANTVVARVGNELVKSKLAGLVIMARTDIGKQVSPGEKIVSIIDPNDLRVVGRLAEDKGLSKVAVGQRATFTVDAFGGRVFNGIVDEVSPTSRAGDVVFSISDKRQENEFNVKVRFNIDTYSELKNGMSAKLKVYRN